mmetsp:Transcript_13346/g.35001  ORF Transcript_13346/g.35001 Transcript_13346/m.35001 type:complete len:203 (+) Transcript_13346:780-1388(+)
MLLSFRCWCPSPLRCSQRTARRTSGVCAPSFSSSARSRFTVPPRSSTAADRRWQCSTSPTKCRGETRHSSNSCSWRSSSDCWSSAWVCFSHTSSRLWLTLATVCVWRWASKGAVRMLRQRFFLLDASVQISLPSWQVAEPIPNSRQGLSPLRRPNHRGCDRLDLLMAFLFKSPMCDVTIARAEGMSQGCHIRSSLNVWVGVM